MPLSLCVILISLRLVILWFTQRQTLGKAVTSSGLALLLLFSWQPLATQLLRPIEQQVSSFDSEQQIDYIVVLGNDLSTDNTLPKHNQLSSSATAKLVEGIRIANAHPTSKIIFTGHASENKLSSAQAYTDMAISMGIESSRIIKLESAKNTIEEAAAIKNIVGKNSMALVTRASHMPRVLNYFEKQELNISPSPVYYLAKNSEQTNWRFDANGLLKSERAIFEYLGLLWQRRKI